MSVRLMASPPCHLRHGLLLAVVAAICCGGCSKPELDRAVVHGEVTYQGQAVPRGTLRFIPVDGTEGPPSGAAIQDGKYTAKALGGIPPGIHRVEILGYQLLDTDENQNFDGPTLNRSIPNGPQYLPAQYNAASELFVEIEPGAEQTKNFHLE